MENTILYAAVLTFVLLLVESTYYIYHTYKKNIQPTIATWLIFAVATFISASSYMVATEKKWMEGVLIVSDSLFTFLTLVFVFLFTKSKFQFNAFQIFYLTSAFIIVALWIFTKSAFYANILVQLLIALGYIPTIESLAKAEKNPESLFAWSLTFAAGAVSFYPAYQGGNTLSILYSIRSMVLIGILLVMILRLKRKESKSEKNV
ncbi:MAG: hypothetical protein HUU50_06355 [Candidatus Brocadiae bacterium]|nr:hypothetical protein [Candidatus Brocadiia bacterium]